MSKCVRSVVATAMVLALAACGGGGSGGSGAGGAIVVPTHQSPNHTLAAGQAPHVAARAVAVFYSMHWLGATLVDNFQRVSPANPTFTTACSGGGDWTIGYTDVDANNAVSPGDRITMSAPGCSIAPFGNGSAVATVQSAQGGQFTDLNIAVAGGTLPPLSGWGWLPAASGELRLTASGGTWWLRSETGLRFDVDAAQWLFAERIGLQLGSAAGNPPAPGATGGFDLTLHDGVIGEGRVQLDTDGGIVAAMAPNSAPAPGALLLRGAGATRMSIADAGGASPGWFRIRTDGTGSGTFDGDVSISFLDIFDAL